MGRHTIHDAVAAALAAIGGMLVAFDTIEHHAALVMGGFSLLALAVAIFFTGWRSDSRIAAPWGALFVSLVYASAAVLLLVLDIRH